MRILKLKRGCLKVGDNEIQRFNYKHAYQANKRVLKCHYSISTTTQVSLSKINTSLYQILTAPKKLKTKSFGCAWVIKLCEIGRRCTSYKSIHVTHAASTLCVYHKLDAHNVCSFITHYLLQKQRVRILQKH